MLLYCLYSKVVLFAGGCAAPDAHTAKEVIATKQAVAPALRQC
jgi:hypothetical protein